MGGAEQWIDIETYGQEKEAWLKTFLELPKGIPSHDTIARVFGAWYRTPRVFGAWHRTPCFSVNNIYG
jgi:hypothetical protein